MRLTCPNCSAEYEVDASVIPPDGRDVQCSNCSHTWFEGPAGASATISTPPEPAPTAPPPAQSAAPAPRAPRIIRGPEPRIKRSRVAAERAQRSAAPGTPSEEAVVEFTAPPVARARKPVDDEVLQVLREEAAREQKVRRGEPVDMFQNQPELALDGEAPRQARREVIDPNILPDEALVPSGTIGRRRDPGRAVLPDIEEINSSLRSSSERKDSVPAYVEVEQTLRKVRRGQGFRLGFSLMLACAAIGMFLYVFAPELSNRWPQATPHIEAFVQRANTLRALLDSSIRAVTDSLTTMITENSG